MGITVRKLNKLTFESPESNANKIIEALDLSEDELEEFKDSKKDSSSIVVRVNTKGETIVTLKQTLTMKINLGSDEDEK